jgi:hypothetical protein
MMLQFYSLNHYYLFLYFNTNNIIIFNNCVVKMAGEKVVPPKPEGLKKKEERDTKIATALKQLRQERRASNKVNR